MGNNILKYLFIVIVVGLIGFGIYKMNQDKSQITNETIDQTSTLSTIQTDLRLAVCNFDTMNPLLSNNRNVQEISKIIFEPLVTLNESYKMQYCLAEEIAKTDERSYVIKLRKGVLFQDGTELTANDIRFTIDTILKGGINTVYVSNLRNLAEFQEIDPYTFKLVLSEPVEFFEYNLTFPILSQTYYEGQDFANTEKNLAPIGTGMFQIANVDSNVIKLVKNEQYWDISRMPMAKEISIHLYGSASELYNAFKNGEIDIVDVKIRNVEEYIGSLGYKKIEYKSRNYDFLALNTQSEVLSDTAVRKAISKIIDKNNVIASCLGAGYVVSNFSLDMGNWLYTKDLNVQPNAEEAGQILINSGWEYKNNKWRKNMDGKNIELAFTISVNGNQAQRIAVAENIKNQLTNFGMQVSVRQLNNETYQTSLENKNFDVMLTGIECGFSPSLATFFGNGNIANYSNPQVAEAMNMISNTSDENVLYENYNKLYDIYLEEVPYIGLYRGTDVIIYNQSLAGNIKPNAFNIYGNIEKWYRQ